MIISEVYNLQTYKKANERKMWKTVNVGKWGKIMQNNLGCRV